MTRARRAGHFVGTAVSPDVVSVCYIMAETHIFKLKCSAVCDLLATVVTRYLYRMVYREGRNCFI